MANEEEIIKKLSEISIKQAAQQISISKSMKKWKLAFSIYSDMNQFEKVFFFNQPTRVVFAFKVLSHFPVERHPINSSNNKQAMCVCVCVRDVERNK